MRRKRLVVIAVLTGAIGAAGWLAADRMFPVPVALVGEWVNETPIIAAGPGEVRLTIGRDGSAVATIDRERYVWWRADRYQIRVQGHEIVVRVLPDGQPVTARIDIETDRFRLSDPAAPDPDRDTLVFLRVRQ